MNKHKLKTFTELDKELDEILETPISIKNQFKTQTHYSFDLKLGDYETLEIIQEENAIDRNAIKVKFFEERWQEPKDVIKLLEEIIKVVKNNFV